MYVAWQNPDGQQTVTFDGFEAKIYTTLTLPPAWSDQSTLSTTPPEISFKFQDNSTSGKQFDIHPGSAYSAGAEQEDEAQNGANSITVVTANGTDLCTERWTLSPTAVACVEMKGELSRKRNTGDTAHDIILDYSYSYLMHAMIGRVADESDEALSFATQEVDFTAFFAGAVSSTSAYAAAIIATLYAMTI